MKSDKLPLLTAWEWQGGIEGDFAYGDTCPTCGYTTAYTADQGWPCPQCAPDPGAKAPIGPPSELAIFEPDID